MSNRVQGPTLDVEKGEFTCPLCRQLANIVLPVIPERVFHPDEDDDDVDSGMEGERGCMEFFDDEF